jgi:large subunit ribosomal protein L18
MKRLVNKNQHLALRQARVRAKLTGVKTRPRLSVNISNRHVSAQLIDDEAGKTLAYVSTVGQKSLSANKTERSEWVGQEIAKKATASKIDAVIFDRGGKLYHGHIKKLAEAAREKGLRF